MVKLGPQYTCIQEPSDRETKFYINEEYRCYIEQSIIHNGNISKIEIHNNMSHFSNV